MPASAALSPSGLPSLVSPNDGRDHLNPDVALDSAGNAVVVWQSLSATTGYDIYAQRYDAQGHPLGAAFVVNAYTAGDQRRPSVAMDDMGNFIVAWEGPGNGTDPAGAQVYDTQNIWGRRFNANGTSRSTGDLALNRSAAGSQFAPQLAVDASGDYVVAWYGEVPGDSAGVAFARFNSSGLSLSPADQLPYDPASPGSQNRPSIAMTPVGAFAISWDTEIDDLVSGSISYAVATHRYSSAGVSESSDTIATGSAGVLRESALSFDTAGALFVVWVERNVSETGGTIWLRRFPPGGGSAGLPQQLSPATLADRYSPSLVVDGAGALVALWGDATTVSSGSIVGVAARELDTLGQPQEAEFYPALPAPAGTLEHLAAARARSVGGTMIVVWDSDTQPAGNLLPNGSIYMRRYPGAPTSSSGRHTLGLPLLHQ